MSEPDADDIVMAELVCPRCQTAIADPMECSRCGWIQYRRDETVEAPPIASNFSTQLEEISPESKSNGREDISKANHFLFLIGTCLIIGLLCTVIVAMTDPAPGTAVCLVVLALPPVVRTAVVVARRSRKGLVTSKEKASRLFVSSLLVTTLLGSTLAVMSVVFAFFAMAFSLISLLLFCFKKPTQYSAVDLAATPIGWFLIVMVIAPYLFLIVSRWQKDTMA